MKHIDLKVVDVIDPSGKHDALDYRRVLVGIVSLPSDPRAGIKVDEIRRSIRVLDAIEAGNENGFDIEDADFDFMCTKVRSATFNFAHRAFVQFVEDICGP